MREHYSDYEERVFCRSCDATLGFFDRTCRRCGAGPWGTFKREVGRWRYDGPWWFPWSRKTWVGGKDDDNGEWFTVLVGKGGETMEIEGRVRMVPGFDAVGYVEIQR